MTPPLKALIHSANASIESISNGFVGSSKKRFGSKGRNEKEVKKYVSGEGDPLECISSNKTQLEKISIILT